MVSIILSIFHIEYNSNFAFTIQHIIINTIKQMKMAWPQILIPVTNFVAQPLEVMTALSLNPNTVATFLHW